MPRPTKKRKLSTATDLNTNSSATSIDVPIENSRELQNLTADYTGAGLRRFRDFLRTTEADSEDVARNRGILNEYLEARCRNVGGGGEDDGGETPAFADFSQIWGWASQNNSINILSLLPATLSVLVRLCSHHEPLRAYGKILIKSLLQTNTLKIIYRSISGNRDHVSSPCLRLLTEMNRFEYGTMCGAVHAAFDFTVKDLPRNLEVRGAAAKAGVEDPTKPSVRTWFVRFFLSFLQNGSSSIRNEVLGLRNWVSPVFKYIKLDAPGVAVDLLETMKTKVLADKDIPRQTKTIVFNEWVLGHVAQLYEREETVKVRAAGKEEETTLAKVVHEFLLTACTHTGNGICFGDKGWYPPGSMPEAGGPEEKRFSNNSAPKVYNRMLSSFMFNIRPFADSLQLDLLLAIFRASPELVADYFLSNSSFSFDPKLTSTWVGYCTLLLESVALPVPDNFGLKETPMAPPPASIVVENILPKPLTKIVMTKCFTHENGLIVFLSTRLLITVFQKLRRVLDAMNEVASAIFDPQETWAKAKSDLLEEFCRRVPDIAVITGSLGLGKAEKSGVLQIEARTRLLAQYYAELPEIALAGKYDIDAALAKFLAISESNEDKEDEGIKLLSMGHLLKIAKAVPDAKWWNKSPSMPHSPFVSILKLCCTQSSGVPLGEIRDLLHYFISASYLFQTETAASSLDSLLESLSNVESMPVLESILSLLDESVARCIRTPFKYLDDCEELITTTKGTTSNTPTSTVSPLMMVLVEQWPFFDKADKVSKETKIATSQWLRRLLESCVLLGENRNVLSTLCDRLVTSSNGESKKEFMELRKSLQPGNDLELVTSEEEEGIPSTIRSIFVSLRQLRVDILSILVEMAKHRIDISVFDLVVVQEAAAAVTRSTSVPLATKTQLIQSILDLIEIITNRLIAQGNATIDKTKAVLINNGPCLDVFLKPADAENLAVVVELSERYAKVVASILKEDHIQASQDGTIFDNMYTFVDIFPGFTKDMAPKILSVYCSLASRLLINDIERLIERLCSVSGGSNELRGELLSAMLQNLAVRQEALSSATVNQIIEIVEGQQDDLDLARALASYITHAPINSLDGIRLPARDVIPTVECALIKKLPSARDASLQRLDLELQSGKAINGLAASASALLEAYSVSTHDISGKMFDWIPTADTSIRLQLEEVFVAAQEEIFINDGPLTIAQIALLSRAASLFPSLDHERALRRVASERKRGVLGAELVNLVDVLMKNPWDAELREMKGWLLMVFDHLTRRFAEDPVLDDKTTAFSKAFGDFLTSRKIELSKVLPRAAVNAALEAGLQKHIYVSNVIQFAGNVVSLSTAKYLDAAKLFQMVLGHPDNPLKLRDSHFETTTLHLAIAYLTQKLFSVGKPQLSNIATLDGVMELYRGSNDAIDTVLLDIMVEIEGHLARSCASRIVSWTLAENAEGRHLISRSHGHLNLVIDGKLLSRSVWQFAPRKEKLGNKQYKNFEKFLGVSNSLGKPYSIGYNWEFMLPALAYCLAEDHMDAQIAVGRGCVAFAVTGLCSINSGIRNIAKRYLGAVVVKLEEVPSYRPKTQISHLLCALLASLDARDEDEPLSSIIGLFLAQAVQIVINPAHFLYANVMTLLLRRPLLDLNGLPLLLTFREIGEENWHKELFWKLNILANGLKTPNDLELLRKRNVFALAMVQYNNPSLNDKCKEKVLELLWNATGIEGGATMLITRFGMVAWISGLLSIAAKSERITLERLRCRLAIAADQGHLQEWSRSTFVLQFEGLPDANTTDRRNVDREREGL